MDKTLSGVGWSILADFAALQTEGGGATAALQVLHQSAAADATAAGLSDGEPVPNERVGQRQVKQAPP